VLFRSRIEAVRRHQAQRTGQLRGLADGDLARVWNDRASLAVPVRVSDRMRAGVAAIPFGWWRDHHVDGRTANSLTNDTLTEWGGGVAYSDTLVQVAALPG
jgi:anaerobic selenocysteine-containing dehydrogenase